MEDYPRNQTEFELRFSTEAACEAYLLRLRWPEGFVCPRCSGNQGWVTKRGLVMCKDCGYQSSLRAGTIFEGSRKPLGTWFRAMWYLTGAKNGASAVTVQRVLGLGSYQTAWTWLHKLRRAMLRKTMVVVAAECKATGIGRIRMRRVQNGKARSLHPFVLDCIEPGSTLYTDDWQGYAGLDTKGYQRQPTAIARSGKTASEVLPRVHRVVSLLKRWLMGTHQGAVSHQHLDYYLDEFAFRCNRRTSGSRGKLFYRLMQNAVRVPPISYQSLVQGVRGRKNKTDDNI